MIILFLCIIGFFAFLYVSNKNKAEMVNQIGLLELKIEAQHELNPAVMQENLIQINDDLISKGCDPIEWEDYKNKREEMFRKFCG